jgi:SRSO17 transposase
VPASHPASRPTFLVALDFNIARVVGLSNEQSLLHFLTESPWKLEQLRQTRLKLILQVLAGREITLIIDEIGNRKKGETTDYVKR